jgi:hypothetical protein
MRAGLLEREGDVESFFDWQDIMDHKFIPLPTRVKKERSRTCCFIRQSGQPKAVHPHDNALAQWQLLLQQKLAKHSTVVILTHTYCPNPAPCDF